jgi:ABC-type bacteriocin/lantibiotic exporter with double-glycine peptidase domain
MALVMLAIIPLLGGSGATMSYFLTKYTTESENSFAEAGSVAEQAFQSIRTVYTFSLQKLFSQRYERKSMKPVNQVSRVVLLSVLDLLYVVFIWYIWHSPLVWVSSCCSRSFKWSLCFHCLHGANDR